MDFWRTSTNCYEFILNKTLKLYYTTVKKNNFNYELDLFKWRRSYEKMWYQKRGKDCSLVYNNRKKKKIKNTRDVLSRTKSNWATYRKININLHVNVFDIARATYLIFSNNSACVINYPVQTHYPENTQITFPWTEFYSQTGRINYSPVSRDSKWLRR